VSKANVGTEHPESLYLIGLTGTNLDECRSNAVDHKLGNARTTLVLLSASS
jgi:hypothetical protein